ncbi:MAG TPA: hypothetical protein VE870_06045, partial [Bacteroidales bacterium]|nr:hypothetical protein [Bacteroidales bacterium]
FSRWAVLRRILTLSSFTGYYKASRDYLQPVIRSAVLVLPLMANLGNKQRTAVFIGVVYFLIYLLNAFSSRNSGRFFDWIRNYERALLFTLLAGFGMGIIAGVLFKFDLKLAAVLPFLFIFIIENVRKPIGIAYISENMEQNLMATSLSAESQISSLIAGGIAILLGFVADRFSIGISLLSVTALLLIAVPFIFSKASRNN